MYIYSKIILENEVKHITVKMYMEDFVIIATDCTRKEVCTDRYYLNQYSRLFNSHWVRVYECPSICAIILKDMEKAAWYETTTHVNKARTVHISMA